MNFRFILLCSFQGAGRLGNFHSLAFEDPSGLLPSEPSKRYSEESVSILIGLTALLRLSTSLRLPSSPSQLPLFRRSTLGFEPPFSGFSVLPRKEVIQPHLPIRLPCYDFTPVIGLTFGSWLLSVTSLTSGAPNSHGVTGGVYKARERIHRGMLIRDY